MSIENFYTLDEALSIIYKKLPVKKISFRELLIKAINKKTVLSVYFDAEVPMLKCCLLDDSARERDDAEKSYLVRKKCFDQNIIEIDYSDEVFCLKGLFDLTMHGAERGQIEKYLVSCEFGKLETEMKIGAILKNSNDYFELSRYEIELDKYLYGGNSKGPLRPSEPDNPRMYQPASLDSINQIVIKASILKDLILEESAISHPQLSPQEIVKRGKKAGKKDYQIAHDIDLQYKDSLRLTNKELGRLFGPEASDDAYVKRAQRLRNKYRGEIEKGNNK